ncbi:MAG: 5-(carboxyamino)imidazole ribonucleotide synthase [Candidatus Diapherotrites archaeon]|nr:5-(carboxyamino)imidazole ribonucleotide synthase [Candidatus Diapherotrites archaeon]
MRISSSERHPRIGIVGGGQLGKMLCLQAQKMGLYVTVLDPTPNCPAKSVSNEQIVADFKDEDAIRLLATKSDVLTFEIELANSKVLKEIERTGVAVHPSPDTLYIIQSKLRQKEFLRQNDLPVPRFRRVENAQQLAQALLEFNGHGMLKASTDSYDGRGNLEITDHTDLDTAMRRFAGRELFLEEWIDFDKELSVMVARNARGEIAAYPVAENVHSESILDMSIVPARVDQTVLENAQRIAHDTMRQLHGSGVFGIELFLTKNGRILINEIAPRVHNSGHYTIEAAKTSQFEQHLRAILDWPLGSTELLQNCVMVNVLGNGVSGPYQVHGRDEVLAIPGATLHMYGKHETRHKRKMGHVTILDADVESALRKADLVKQKLKLEGA